MPRTSVLLTDAESRKLSEHLLKMHYGVSRSDYFRWLMKKEMSGAVKVYDTVEDFMMTTTHRYDRGYTIYTSEAAEFANEAVVEDDDGKQALIDIGDAEWEDNEDFLDLVVEKYEGGIKMIKELEKLIGRQMTASDLDEEIAQLTGRRRVFDTLGWSDAKEQGALAYGEKEGEVDGAYNVGFEIIKDGDDERSAVIKVADVEKL